MEENKSEVTQFREQQALHERAAQQGLYGLAVVANHNSITARLHRGAARILNLMHEGKVQEAIRVMDQPDWGADMQETLPEMQDKQED